MPKKKTVLNNNKGLNKPKPLPNLIEEDILKFKEIKKVIKEKIFVNEGVDKLQLNKEGSKNKKIKK
jgi:hypothetical protein